MNPKERKKLLVVDLDGTLLTTDKKILPRDLEAISRLTERGHYFAFNTGRPVQSALPIAQEYGFDRLDHFCIIAYNGALIYDCSRRKTIETHPLKRSIVRLIFDEAKKAQLHCHTYDKNHVIAEWETEILREYTRIIKMPTMILEDASVWEGAEPLKVIVADLDRKRLEAFLEVAAPKIRDEAEVVFSSDILLEFSDVGVDKGSGTSRLCKLLGVDPSDTVAVGDQENDLALLRFAGLSCAMKNAVPCLKEAADMITEEDNDHGGIAWLIDSVILKGQD